MFGFGFQIDATFDVYDVHRSWSEDLIIYLYFWYSRTTCTNILETFLFGGALDLAHQAFWQYKVAFGELPSELTSRLVSDLVVQCMFKVCIPYIDAWLGLACHNGHLFCGACL